MSLNLKLLKKIHHDAGEKSHIAITKDWKREDDHYELEDNMFYDKLFKMQDFISTVRN